jgi:hypothetical protein
MLDPNLALSSYCSTAIMELAAAPLRRRDFLFRVVRLFAVLRPRLLWVVLRLPLALFL